MKNDDRFCHSFDLFLIFSAAAVNVGSTNAIRNPFSNWLLISVSFCGATLWVPLIGRVISFHLNALEKAKLVESNFGLSGGNRPQAVRYYSITPKGEKIFRMLLDMLKK